MIFIGITPLKLLNFPSNKKGMGQRNFMTQMRINVLKLMMMNMQKVFKNSDFVLK